MYVLFIENFCSALRNWILHIWGETNVIFDIWGELNTRINGRQQTHGHTHGRASITNLPNAFKIILWQIYDYHATPAHMRWTKANSWINLKEIQGHVTSLCTTQFAEDAYTKNGPNNADSHNHDLSGTEKPACCFDYNLYSPILMRADLSSWVARLRWRFHFDGLLIMRMWIYLYLLVYI